jgi:hypothetical protein
MTRHLRTNTPTRTHHSNPRPQQSRIIRHQALRKTRLRRIIIPLHRHIAAVCAHDIHRTIQDLRGDFIWHDCLVAPDIIHFVRLHSLLVVLDGAEDGHECGGDGARGVSAIEEGYDLVASVETACIRSALMFLQPV